ncbi:N-acyl homoserine lactonase family protein [Tunicatimonas pelagia]|uniref:N-acyl homoserine lactonase family protein n=1 Tax=Tunicatimonas pelagia TaxID=931531 RepID=UPI0026660F13|nr:N-acyl homoserine lactonase family protein [Tunicatimonas pelagia]WKN43441.1 N-acyl homoserine lactonase family protein [Tunicatimonas pelagia]
MTHTLSKPIRFKEGDGALHGFTTGRVKVKSKFRTAQGNAFTSKINFLLDRQFTEYMPIMVWVLDHPEGVFVVDTGENAKVSNQGYFKKEGPLANYINTKSFIFDVEPEEEIGPQLKRLGYSESSIKSVVLTHLHLDHFDGLHYFETTDIVINQLEWEKPSFALPSLYPEWFSPSTVQLKEASDRHFKHSLPLVASGEIKLVHTPGHTVGHCSVLVKTADMHYLLAGDITYNQHQLQNNIYAGGHQSFRLSGSTYQAVREYASKNKLVYLPSHDNQALDRIQNDTYLTTGLR